MVSLGTKLITVSKEIDLHWFQTHKITRSQDQFFIKLGST